MLIRNWFLILMVLACSTATGQGIQHSHHDFTGSGWNSSQACLPCHIPKTSAIDSLNSALWNLHKTSFEYASFSNPASEKYAGDPSGKSKLCLSCHDGTVAIEKHVAMDVSNITTSTRFISLGLTEEHPVSIRYNTSNSYRVLLNNPNTTMSGLGGTIAQDLLEDGNIECTSCHDVHVSRNNQGCTGCHSEGVSAGAGISSLSLWKTNNYSALCITCHKK